MPYQIFQVVRAMKDTLKNCEVEMRGELQVHSDGIHFVGPGGIKGGKPYCILDFATTL